MAYFPLFVELKGARCLVVGGGQIALHKAKVLHEFGAEVTAVAKEVLPELKEVCVSCRKRGFLQEDLDGQALVVAATDDAGLNRRISILCRTRRVPVNAVDQIEDCSFIFPAYLKEEEVVAAFVSGGQSPVVTQYLKEQTRPVLTELVGRLASQLGSLRETVKRSVPERERKAVYRELLRLGLERERILTEEEIGQILGGRAKWKE